MKKSFLIYIISGIATVAVSLIISLGCTTLQSLEEELTGIPQTNITTVTDITTNITVITNITYDTNEQWVTNFIEQTNIIYTSTNFTYKSVSYEPIPNKLWIHVDSGSHLTWDTPMIHWWDFNGNSGDITEISNYNDGYIDWWVFSLDNVNFREKYGIKVHNNNWAAQEPIKTENGALYDRIVSIPMLGKEILYEASFTNGDTVSNVTIIEYQTFNKIYVYPPYNWWESYPYFFETETNYYKPYTDLYPDKNIWDDEWFGAHYKGDGITFFKFYGPNIRRVWVAGDFSNWEKVPMNLDTGRVFWWTELSNTQGGQAYKFVIEKYANQWGGPYTHWISDPAAKKNEHSPAMDTAGNRSFIIDHDSYVWQNTGWQRPGHDWYIIYQMHLRSWWTNGPGDYYGQGTFDTAVNKMPYLQDLGFTAIYPLPINEFAGDVSWGYNYVLFYAPESAYIGTEMNTVDPYKRFVDEAHGHGMAVVQDLVFNHMGASDDIVGAFDPSINWEWPDTYWYNGKTDWGPRFNYSNPVIRHFLIESAKYFVKYYRVDAFRFDATKYIYEGYGDGWNFLQELTEHLRGYRLFAGHGGDNEVLLMAENLPAEQAVTKKTTADGLGFHSQWNVESAHELKKLFISGPTAIDIGRISHIITVGYDQQSGGNLDTENENNQSPVGLPCVNYAVSHDEAGNGKQRGPFDLRWRGWGTDEYDATFQQLTALATAFMAKGIPQMFMGEEFIQGWYEDNTGYFSVEDMNSWYVQWQNLERNGGDATRRAVKDLIRIRRDPYYDSTYDNSIRGTGISVTHQNNFEDNRVIAFGRGQNIFVIINYNKIPYPSYGLNFPDEGKWDLIYASPSQAYHWETFEFGFTGSVNGWGSTK